MIDLKLFFNYTIFENKILKHCKKNKRVVKSLPIYDIAGLKVKMNNCGGRTQKQSIAYLSENQSENQKVDIEIFVDESRIKEAMTEHPEMNSDDWEYMITGSDFYKAVIRYKGILLHSSCVVVDGVAYAFSADSGTGKSTHTQMWLKKFGERAYILNDDKPCIRIIDGKVYACGTPWSGKYDYSVPEIVPLGAICFLERSETNHIEPCDIKKAVYNVFSQTVRRFGPNAMERLFDILEEIFRKIPIYQLGCNISEEAVEISYNAMKRDVEDL